MAIAKNMGKPIHKSLIPKDGFFRKNFSNEEMEKYRAEQEAWRIKVRQARAENYLLNDSEKPVHPADRFKQQIMQAYPSGLKSGEVWLVVKGTPYRMYEYPAQECEVAFRIEKCGRLDWAPKEVQQALWK